MPGCVSKVAPHGRWRLVAIAACLAVSPTIAGASASCRQPVSAADMRAIERVVVFLPAVGSKQFPMTVGASVPRDIPTKAVPRIVTRILPGHAGDRAFRSGSALMIVDPRSRRIVHVLRTGRNANASCP